MNFSIPVILASARADDRAAVAALLAGSPWTVVETSTPAQAIQALRLAKFPIILCDPALAAGHGPNRTRRMLRGFLRARRGACAIVLMDHTSDTACFAPPLAFDAVFRPLNKQEVFRALLFAYSRCKIQWPIGVLARPPKRAAAAAAAQ